MTKDIIDKVHKEKYRKIILESSKIKAIDDTVNTETPPFFRPCYFENIGIFLMEHNAQLSKGQEHPYYSGTVEGKEFLLIPYSTKDKEIRYNCIPI